MSFFVLTNVGNVTEKQSFYQNLLNYKHDLKTTSKVEINFQQNDASGGEWSGVCYDSL